jgi:hypothetical protein
MGGVSSAIPRLVVEDAVRYTERTLESFTRAQKPRPDFLGAAWADRMFRRTLARSASDAAEAERLLLQVRDREPAFDVVLDAVRGFQALQESGVARGPAVHGTKQSLQRGLHAVEAWRRVEGLDDAARHAELDRIRQLWHPTHATRDDWLVLAGIIGDDVGGSLAPELPRSFGSGPSLREVALDMLEGPRNVWSDYWPGHRYLEFWKAPHRPQADRLASLETLFAQDPTKMNMRLWSRLAAHLDAGGHDVVNHPWFPQMTATEGARLAMFGGYSTMRFPTREAVVEAGRQLREPGELGALARWSIARSYDGDELAKLGITMDEAPLARVRHMSPTDRWSAQQWLSEADTALQRLGGTGAAANLRDEALQLVDRNVARIEGRLFDGLRGYPDYADIGRIRSTFRLLEQLDLLDARTTEAAATITADAASGARQLSW